MSTLRRSVRPSSPRRKRSYTLIATLTFSAIAFTAGVFACRKTASNTNARPTASAAEDGAALPDPRFCGKGLSPIAGGGCFSAPPGTGDFPLVVYLHGLHDDTTLGEELARQSRLAEMGARHEGRFGVLALHGKKGDCTLRRTPGLYCWPSNDFTAAEAPAIVASFARAIGEAGERGARGRRYLFGFSNGGYFAVLIAERALAKFDAVVVAHGGPMPPTERPSPAPPLLLLTADDDSAIDDMMRLSRELLGVQWNHTLLSRDGVHGLPETDIATALDFFESTAKHRLFSPPPSSHPPRPKSRIAPEEIADADADANATKPTNEPVPLADPPAVDAPPPEAAGPLEP